MMNLIPRLLAACLLLVATAAEAQERSKVWVPDLGDGTYKNPVLNADYSDPDVIRVGADYYLTSSSFEDMPGLPVLHSKDLVNWEIVGHALAKLPGARFDKPQHGGGVWAPALRYRNGLFYLYYPDPDSGIFLLRAPRAEGPWSEPLLVAEGKGLIDPCPLWDDDGNAYLVHAFAGSRAGIKSVLALRRLSPDGTKCLDTGTMIFDGHATDPTIEGPKIYKHQGWYYIFAPAGGVSAGWQIVLRSKNIYGPYERRVVMDQGKSPVNGPHQGAWVSTPAGADWFLHFQDKGAYGRVVHLQPMRWNAGWPVIGSDPDGDGKGEPVLRYRKPVSGTSKMTPSESDEFNGNTVGLQWQWPANPKAAWAFPVPSEGVLRLFSDALPDGANNLWGASNLLLQKLPADSFKVTVKLTLMPNPKLPSEEAGLAMMGLNYVSIALRHAGGRYSLQFRQGMEADANGPDNNVPIADDVPPTVFLRMEVLSGARCRFGWSADGRQFVMMPFVFNAKPGRWKGAKMGLYCLRDGKTNDSGHADVDWFRVESL